MDMETTLNWFTFIDFHIQEVFSRNIWPKKSFLKEEKDICKQTYTEFSNLYDAAFQNLRILSSIIIFQEER